MKSELAKTLRAMSDDHRMVPDFSEQLLDVADTIERLQKEIKDLKAENKTLKDIGYERDAALAEVERLKSSLTIVSGVSEDFKSRLTAAPRCQLCGERVEPPRSFCSICCAQ